METTPVCRRSRSKLSRSRASPSSTATPSTSHRLPDAFSTPHRPPHSESACWDSPTSPFSPLQSQACLIVWDDEVSSRTAAALKRAVSRPEDRVPALPEPLAGSPAPLVPAGRRHTLRATRQQKLQVIALLDTALSRQQESAQSCQPSVQSYQQSTPSCQQSVQSCQLSAQSCQQSAAQSYQQESTQRCQQSAQSFQQSALSCQRESTQRCQQSAQGCQRSAQDYQRLTHSHPQESVKEIPQASTVSGMQGSAIEPACLPESSESDAGLRLPLLHRSQMDEEAVQSACGGSFSAYVLDAMPDDEDEMFSQIPAEALDGGQTEVAVQSSGDAGGGPSACVVLASREPWGTVVGRPQPAPPGRSDGAAPAATVDHRLQPVPARAAGTAESRGQRHASAAGRADGAPANATWQRQAEINRRRAEALRRLRQNQRARSSGSQSRRVQR